MVNDLAQKQKMKQGDAEEGDRGAIQNLVYEELRRSLIVGTFPPGTKLTLRNLARQVGTSITPVRVAVNRLVAEGAFEMLPNRWLAIPAMTREKFDEITHWRIQLESEAVRRACKHIDKALLALLRSTNRQLLDAIKRGDRSDLLSINYEFHFAVYRAAQSAILVPMIESLWLRTGPFTYFSLNSSKEMWTGRHHIALIEALERKDPGSAVTALTQDILGTANELRKTSYYSQPTLRRVSS